MTKSLVPRAERVSINREFESVEAFINEYVANLSRSGAFIKSKDPLPIGTRVNLKFTVIMDELESIEGVGEVVRVSENPRGMGVVFVELTSYSQDLIAKLMTQRTRLHPGAQRRPLAPERK
jgi:PilZ domain